MFYRSRVVLSALSLALGMSTVAAGTTYTLTDLGTATGSGNSYGYGLATVSGNVQVVGRTAGSTPTFTGDPAIWSGGTCRDLLSTMSGATAGSFEAMDASGDAVGRATIGGKYYAAYLPAGDSSATVLPVLNTGTPYGWAYGISSTGIIAGFSTSTDAYGNNHACVWTTPGPSRTWADWRPTPGRCRLWHQQQWHLHGWICISHQRQPDGGPGGWVPTVWTNSGSGWTCANVNPSPSVCAEKPRRWPSTTVVTRSAPGTDSAGRIRIRVPFSSKPTGRWPILAAWGPASRTTQRGRSTTAT